MTKYLSEHTCSLEMRTGNHRQAKSWVIGHLIKSKYEQVGRIYYLRYIIEDVRREYGVNITYGRAYCTKEYRLMYTRGPPEGSYAIVRAYDEALKLANLGTIFEVEVEDVQYFKYVFMALCPCIRGFLNCIRPVIVVDGTHFHEKYKGMLLITTCIDGNNNIYPIAFSIVDCENDASWTWFMTHLKASIGDVSNLVIISNRHISIAKAIARIFPSAFHALCIYHIRNNLLDKFKNEDIIPHFYLAAKAYRISEFQMYWAKLHQYPGVTAYLEEFGLQRWARVYQLHCRYDKMTTNIVEYLNGVLKDA
ncbi:protein FAR-RED ELONGATED HYPOCOTYL 3-like [Benincasa hispida]|uniref:protein FAR-RED ELONGATED HYPOCOTYL 3-like n=1 Tax=Benincasa hispida TaxID=102211 RepID=UPI0019014D85|nr:protein FAR-RED ELONGATED HYPOCOTYL 3-like [Benincasa hispida]